MRYKTKEWTDRIVTKFLLFPKKINFEWRWLETATYRQYRNTGNKWYCDRWINN